MSVIFRKRALFGGWPSRENIVFEMWSDGWEDVMDWKSASDVAHDTQSDAWSTSAASSWSSLPFILFTDDDEDATSTIADAFWTPRTRRGANGTDVTTYPLPKHLPPVERKDLEEMQREIVLCGQLTLEQSRVAMMSATHTVWSEEDRQRGGTVSDREMEGEVTFFRNSKLKIRVRPKRHGDVSHPTTPPQSPASDKKRRSVHKTTLRLQKWSIEDRRMAEKACTSWKTCAKLPSPSLMETSLFPWRPHPAAEKCPTSPTRELWTGTAVFCEVHSRSATPHMCEAPIHDSMPFRRMPRHG